MTRLRQFSLRVLFVTMTLTGIAVGLYMYRVSQQRLAVKRIEEVGGAVSYESSYLSDAYVHYVPDWVIPDFLCHVTAVHFAGLKLDVTELPTVSKDGETTIVDCKVPGQINLSFNYPYSAAVRYVKHKDETHIQWTDQLQMQNGRLDFYVIVQEQKHGQQRAELRLKKSAN
jgi:hypothetical protein